MTLFNVFTGVVLLVIGVIWYSLLVAIFKTYSAGDLLLKRRDKMTLSNWILGLSMFAFSIANIYTLTGYSLNMKIINWVAFPTVAFEFMFFGFSQIQFREKAFVWNNFVTKYKDIQSYSWENGDRLVIVRGNTKARPIRIAVLPQYRQEIDTKLQEMIKKAKET